MKMAKSEKCQVKAAEVTANVVVNVVGKCGKGEGNEVKEME